MPPSANEPAADPEPPYPFAVRLRRSLARRFPRTRRLYNWVRAHGGYHLGRLLRALRPRRAIATGRWLAATARAIAARRREQRLTVGVEIAAFWEPLAGIGWYLYRLLESLADRPDLRLRLYGPSVVDSPDLPAPAVTLPSGPAIERVLYEVPPDLALSRGSVIRLLRRLEPVLLAVDRNEVLFAPNFFLPRRFSLCRGARVATIHDLGLRTVPRTLRQETLRELTAKLEHSIFEATRLITVSGAVRDEVVAYGYAAPERVRVVHHGPGHLAEVTPGARPEGTPPRYALHVGTLEPRKNIPRLLEAWRLLRRRGAAPPALVLCGRLGWKAGGLRTAILAAEGEGWLRHFGYVSEEQLAGLYQGAALVVFPSLYEGFGLPAVEAQWAGVPLVCSDIAALREVAGDAALYAPPDRADLLADRIEELLRSDELCARLAERGRRRALELSWGRAADRTAAVWFEAAGRTPPAEGGAAAP